MTPIPKSELKIDVASVVSVVLLMLMVSCTTVYYDEVNCSVGDNGDGRVAGVVTERITEGSIIVVRTGGQRIFGRWWLRWWWFLKYQVIIIMVLMTRW